MHLTSTLFKLVGACALIGAATATAGPHSHEEMKLKIMTEYGAETIMIEDLAVGETRELTTDSGKRVLVTREEQGLVLDFDGKLIELATPAFDHDQLTDHGAHGVMVMTDVDEQLEEGGHRIVIKRRSWRGDEVDDIDVDALLSELDADGRDVVIIKKEVELHEQGDLL